MSWHNTIHMFVGADEQLDCYWCNSELCTILGHCIYRCFVIWL